MPDPHIDTFTRHDNKFDWRLLGANGETICSSSQGFRDRTDAERAAATAQRLMLDATIKRST